MDFERAAHGFLLMEIGMRIVKATMKSKPEISISFEAYEALVMIRFLDEMTGRKPELLYIRNIASQMEIEAQKCIVNYQQVYQ
jgi:hypothetical protein